MISEEQIVEIEDQVVGWLKSSPRPDFSDGVVSIVGTENVLRVILGQLGVPAVCVQCSAERVVHRAFIA